MANPPGMHDYVKNVSELLQAFGNIVSQLLQLVKVEWQLAHKSLSYIIIYSVIVGVLLVSCWGLLLFLSVMVINIGIHNWLYAVLITMILNAALLVFLIIQLGKYFNNLRFPYTRKHLMRWRNSHDKNNQIIKTRP